jgi:hypothetical protein
VLTDQVGQVIVIDHFQEGLHPTNEASVLELSIIRDFIDTINTTTRIALFAVTSVQNDIQIQEIQACNSFISSTTNKIVEIFVNVSNRSSEQNNGALGKIIVEAYSSFVISFVKLYRRRIQLNNIGGDSSDKLRVIFVFASPF